MLDAIGMEILPGGEVRKVKSAILSLVPPQDERAVNIPDVGDRKNGTLLFMKKVLFLLTIIASIALYYFLDQKSPIYHYVLGFIGGGVLVWGFIMES